LGGFIFMAQAKNLFFSEKYKKKYAKTVGGCLWGSCKKNTKLSHYLGNIIDKVENLKI